MIGIGLNIGNRVIVSGGFDADAQAFFNRVTAAGGTLTTTEKNATNQLVLDMKSAGIWSSMKAVYPMVGASAAACAQNLKSSSFTGTFTSGWTFSSSGVNGNGINAYFDTNILPTTQLSISSAQISCYINSAVVSLGVAMGNNDLSCFLQPQSGTLYGSLATTTFLSPLVTIDPAFYMVNRPSINSQKIIKNSTIVNTNTATGVSYSAGQNIFVGAYSPSTFNSSSRFALASIGDGLTDTQASNFYTAVQAFQTTLSRQV